MTTWRRGVLLGLLIFLVGCQAEPLAKPIPFASAISGPANPWNHLRFRTDPGEFHFAIVGDRTGGHRAGVFKRAVAKLNLLQPEFVMCVGDLIEGYTTDTAVLGRQYDEFDKIIAKLEMPFFRVVGNHDITNPVMAKLYRSRHGRAYYHFVYRDVLFLCVSTEDPPVTSISDAQAAYVGEVLAANPDVRWTFVFMHEPLYEARGGKVHPGWAKIEALLKDCPYTVFAGHLHVYAKQVRNGRKYIRLSVTGGTTGPQSIKAKTFDHLVWVTMTAKGPRIANLMLNGIYDEDITVP